MNHKMKRRDFLKSASIGVLSMGATRALLAEPFFAKDVTITFYHTSDLHDHSGKIGRIAEYVQRKKAANKNVLFIDSGDWCNKGDLTPLETRGEAMAALMAACPYDAMIPGNHDYTHGAGRLGELIDKYQLPVLMANCEWPEGAKPKRAPSYRVFRLDGVKVAVIGTATPIMGNATEPLLKVRPIEQSVAKLVEKLDKEVDIIVLLTHVGLPDDQKLAAALPQVDVIFGGHHHAAYKKLGLGPKFKDRQRPYIQNSGSMGDMLGALVISWNGEKITGCRSRLMNVTEKMPESEAVKKVRLKWAPKPAAPAKAEAAA